MPIAVSELANPEEEQLARLENDYLRQIGEPILTEEKRRALTEAIRAGKDYLLHCAARCSCSGHVQRGEVLFHLRLLRRGRVRGFLRRTGVSRQGSRPDAGTGGAGMVPGERRRQPDRLQRALRCGDVSGARLWDASWNYFRVSRLMKKHGVARAGRAAFFICRFRKSPRRPVQSSSSKTASTAAETASQEKPRRASAWESFPRHSRVGSSS